MKSFDGYLKLKLGNDYVLLAGGSHKALSDFLMSSTASDTYVKKAGDTMTGTLTLPKIIYKWQSATAVPIIALNRAEQYGIWYHEGDTDRMMFSASGNANDYTTADLAINGNGNGTVTIRGNTILHAGNSSVSLSGSTLTVKINGTSQSLTNTWRGILNNLTSDSTTDSLSAAQGKALNNKFANYLKNTTDTFTGLLTVNGNGGTPLFIQGGTSGYRHGIVIKSASSWSGILLGDANVTATSGATTNSYWIGNNEGAFCITKGSAGNTATSLYCNGTNWYVNTNLIRHSGDTYVSSGKGYIGGSEITYVNNSGGADHLNFERVSDIHATTGWRMFTTTNSSPSNGPVSGKWMLGLTVLPNNDTNGYRNILAFVDCGSNNELWIQTLGAGTWGSWRILLTNANWSSYITNATLGAQPAGNYVPFETTSSRASVDSTNSYPRFYNLLGNNLISGYLSHFYVINMGHYSGGGYSTQIAMNYDGGSTDSELFIRRELNTTWLPWRRVLHDNNYNLYAVPLTGGKMTGTLIVQTDGTGSYNQGIRVNRNSTSSWCLIMIGTPPNSTGGTGSSQTGWLVGTPASSNSLIFCPNNASESVGLCLKGSGNNDMKWNDNIVYHAGNLPATATRWPKWSEITDKIKSKTIYGNTYVDSNGDFLNVSGWVGGTETGDYSFPGLGANKGIRVVSNAGSQGTLSPNAYMVGLNISGYYGLSIATYGGGNSTTLWWRNNDQSWREIIHSGNYTSYCAAVSHTHSYLPLSGGTLYNGSMHSVHTLNATNGSADAWNKEGNALLRLCSNNNLMIISIGSPSNERHGIILVGHSETTRYASVVSNLSLNPLGGSVGIGTTSISYTLHVNGTCGASNFYTTSDRSKKTNIRLLSEHIRKFTLKETKEEAYGVIAQEIPEMFRDGKEGNMTVNYNSVLSYYIGLLENKVKELEKRLRQLENLNKCGYL